MLNCLSLVLQQFKGVEEAVQRNIEACVELATQIRSAFGPNGLAVIEDRRVEGEKRIERGYS